MESRAADANLITALSDGLPAGTVITDPDLMAGYSTDRAMFCPAGEPAVLVRVTETAHVQHVMRVAAATRTPVVPQGARSGLSGAANATDGCIILSLERMDQIVEIDAANRLVVTQPGVFNAVLSRAVGEHGLFYPPDPSSWEFCSIGGNLSTNSGGLCCVKYGVTTDYVLGLEVVLASGEILRTGRRTVKGVAGYDLTRLFVGAEGTLGVITEATLLLRPEVQRPLTAVAVFDSMHAAAEAVSQITTSGRQLSLLELMDRTTIRAVEDYKHIGLPADAVALLMAQSDAGPVQAAEDLAAFCQIAEAAGAVETAASDDPDEAAMLLEARRSALLALDRLGTTMIDDVCVPRTRLADLVDGIDKIAAEVDLTIGVLGHAGDGNFHPTVVFDASDPGQVERAKRAFDQIMLLALDLGGTITGEHGVGVLKRDLLAREIGDVAIGVHRDLKRALDPLGILNPGKVFDA